MPTADLTTTPTVIDTGASTALWVKNTGTSRVVVTNGAERVLVDPTRDRDIVPVGPVAAFVQAKDGGVGQVIYDASTASTAAPGHVGSGDLSPGLVIDGGTL